MPAVEPAPDDLRPVGVGDILEFAFRIYRQRFGTLVRAAAVVVIPVSILAAIIFLAIPTVELAPATETQPQLVTDPADPLAGVDGSDVALAFGGLLLVGGLGALANQLATAATFMIVTGAYLGTQPSWQESVAFAWRRLGPLLWLQLVYGVFLAIAFIAFIIPGIYLAVAWTVAVPVLLFEDIRGFPALRRSRELLRGRWWPTAALLLIVGLITLVVQTAIDAVLPAVVAGGGTGGFRTFAEAAAGLLGSVIVTPFAAAVITVLFFDALVRKEGFGVNELALRMRVDPPSESPPGWG